MQHIPRKMYRIQHLWLSAHEIMRNVTAREHKHTFNERMSIDG